MQTDLHFFDIYKRCSDAEMRFMMIIAEQAYSIKGLDYVIRSAKEADGKYYDTIVMGRMNEGYGSGR